MKDIKVNRLYVIVKDYSKKKYLLIEVTVRMNNNTFPKEIEKLMKCKDLEIDINNVSIEKQKIADE